MSDDDGLIHGFPASYWENDSLDWDPDPHCRYSPEVRDRMAKRLEEQLALIRELRRKQAQE